MKNADLKKQIIDFSIKYPTERKTGIFKNNKLGNILKNDILMLIQTHSKIISKNKNNFKIKGSIGQGKFADIPWIVILNLNISESATSGYDVVLLFSKDGKRIYLSLNQGWTFFSKKYGKKLGELYIKTISEKLNNYLNLQNDEYFKKNHRKVTYINLKDEKGEIGELGHGYEYGHIAGFKYDIEDTSLTSEEIISDIDYLLSKLNIIIQLKDNDTLEEFNASIIDLTTLNENIIFEKRTIQKELTQIKQKKITVFKPKPIVISNTKSKNLKYKRDLKEVAQSLINSNFECEYEPSHKTFISSKYKKQFMESHHLIPYYKQEEFEYSLDTSANIVSLCPNCHSLIHYAIKSERDFLIETLFLKHENNLKQAGIYISLEKLKTYY